MQGRYAGDVGDFGKFSLLRSIFACPENTIGVVWYKYPDESHNGDGRHIEYLNNQSYKQCDQELVDILSHVVNGERSISHLESVGLLPKNTIYYSSILDFHLTYTRQTNAHKNSRKTERLQWLNKAVSAVKNCDVVFLDPDNGLEINSIPNIHQIKSGKYSYYSEVADLFKNKKACIIYHHMNMNNSHKSQIKQRSKELKEKIVKDGSVFAIRYSPYSPRAYFICAAKTSAGNIKERINAFISGTCGVGWDTYYEA